MTLPRKARCQAMTLVELLVVIGIIAILAALTLAAIDAVWANTDRTTALATITRLYASIETYKHAGPDQSLREQGWIYAGKTGDYPDEESGNAFHISLDTDAADPKNRTGILNALNPQNETGEAISSELFIFDRENLLDGELVDPWQQPYFYDLDGDGARDSNNSPNSDWEAWGVEHPVKIFSCGAKNLNADKDGPKTWDKQKIVFFKVSAP